MVVSKKRTRWKIYKTKKIPLDAFFVKVIAENMSTHKADNAFYIDYLWDKENKTIEITNVTEKELDFFLHI